MQYFNALRQPYLQISAGTWLGWRCEWGPQDHLTLDQHHFLVPLQNRQIHARPIIPECVLSEETHGDHHQLLALHRRGQESCFHLVFKDRQKMDLTASLREGSRPICVCAISEIIALQISNKLSNSFKLLYC